MNGLSDIGLTIRFRLSSSMNLRNTEIFCEIAMHRSFSKAADARNISQPAVSQALHQLEEEMGVTLIDRSQRPIELTSEGTVYYERCQKWLEDYRQIEEAVYRSRGKTVGRVRVVSIYSVGLLQMSTYVKRFRLAYPDVRLSLDYAQTDEVYSRICSDEADLGIVSFPRVGGEISCIPWQDQEMTLAVAPDHPLACLGSIRLEQLAGQDFVSFSPELMIRRETEKLLRKAGVTVNVVHQFDNVENVKRAVEIGLGAAILPRATMLRELDYASLRSLPIDDVDVSRTLGIVHKRNKHLSTAAEKFVQLLLTDVGDAEAEFASSQPVGSPS